MSSIKIFSTHSQSNNERVFVCNEIIQPVLGGAIRKENVAKMQGDNDGENISSLNDVYCELSTQYWAWKNVVLDYYGFCHYRRYFSFNQETLDSDKWNVVNCSFANDYTKEKLALDDVDRIKDIVEKYDILVAEKTDLSTVGYNSVYEQFLRTPFMKSEALDLTMEIIREEYSDYYESAKKYIYGQQFYPYNMFIMKKDLFGDYCSWLFGILSRLIDRLDMSDYSIQSRRIPAHIGERLLGVYITYIMEKDPLIKLKELQVGFIHNPKLATDIPAANEHKTVPIVMAANDFFSPIMSAALCSMVENCDGDRKYEITVLETNILEKTKARLKKIVERNNRFSLRFYNVAPLISDYDLYISKLITVETYFRFLIPELFKGYSKVLYLDGDIIVKHDVSELFDIDIKDNLVGACHDVTCAGLVNGFDPEHYEYCKTKMKLQKPVNQFNAGVMIMNLDAFRNTYSTQYMLDFAEKGKFKFWDQDALNILCENRVFWIDSRWNFFADEEGGWRGNINKYSPKAMYDAYKEAGKDPFIYHFAGNEKPWYDPGYEYAENFWHYLRKSSFYEVMIQRRMTEISDYCIEKRNLPASTPNNEGTSKSVVKRIIKWLFPIGSRRGEFMRRIYYRS